MTVNPHKCSIMHIPNERNTVSTKYTINGFPLNCVSGVKYIDVSIRSKMSWSDHIDDICTMTLPSAHTVRLMFAVYGTHINISISSN